MIKFVVPSLAAAVLVATPAPCAAQLGDFLSQVKDDITGEVRSLDCFARANCGNVTQADHFAPESYESVAVTVFDGTRQFGATGTQGRVRDVFESQLVQNGYLLAANSDVDSVRAMIASGEDSWSDQELAQLKDFVDGIDAVIVVDIRQLDTGTCKAGDDEVGTGATAHLSARWLNVDAGDVPWVATHEAMICRKHGLGVPAEAMELTSKQLASSLPAR